MADNVFVDSDVIVRALADVDPFIGRESGVMACFFCGTTSRRGHRPECLWRRAQEAAAFREIEKMRGLKGG